MDFREYGLSSRKSEENLESLMCPRPRCGFSRVSVGYKLAATLAWEKSVLLLFYLAS